MYEDFNGPKLFEKVGSLDEFHFALGSVADAYKGSAEDTLIFLDEIQVYPNLLTLLKFLADEGRYRYIASGSLLGVTMKQTASSPMGYVEEAAMYPLDFEEFLLASGVSSELIEEVRKSFIAEKTPHETMHRIMMEHWRKYLLIGGLPEAVNAFIETGSMRAIRTIHRRIHLYYGNDASRYDEERKLSIVRIYNQIPSNMENKKKRIVVKDIGGKGSAFKDYKLEFEYLLSSGIALGVKAVSNPSYPLILTETKNLIKLYMNDPGLLSYLLYRTDIRPVLEDIASVNLGSLYETAVACELAAHGSELFYYDNRNKGEVDFLINDYQNMSVVPLEVKSGRDYRIHSALTGLVSNSGYGVRKAYVLSNERNIETRNGITYIPVYFSMFLKSENEEDTILR